MKTNQLSKDENLRKISEFALSNQISASKEEIVFLLNDVEEIFSNSIVEYINLNPRKNEGTGSGGSIHIYYRNPYEYAALDKKWHCHFAYVFPGRYNATRNSSIELKGFHVILPLSFTAQSETIKILCRNKVLTTVTPIIQVYNLQDTYSISGSSRYDFNKCYAERIIGRNQPINEGDIFVSIDQSNRVVFGVVGPKTIDAENEWNYKYLNKVEKWLTGIIKLPDGFDRSCFQTNYQWKQEYQNILAKLLDYIKKEKDLTEFILKNKRPRINTKREQLIKEVISFLNEEGHNYFRTERENGSTDFEFAYSKDNKIHKLRVFIFKTGKVGILGVGKHNSPKSEMYYFNNNYYRLKESPKASTLMEFKDIYNVFIKNL